MRILVTGARGRVGRYTVAHLADAGHDVTATDLAPERPAPPDAPDVPYVQADLTDAGEVFSLVGGWTGREGGPKQGPFDAVVHAGAIPAPGRHAPHTLFRNNVMGVFDVVEACVRWGVPRLVNVSSETVAGFAFSERPTLPHYLPLDEEHPLEPQDPYGLGKVVGEEICDAAVRRSDLRVVSLRPTWVQEESTYEPFLGPLVADPDAGVTNGWSYVDVRDLAEAIRLAVECDLPGHEAFYVSAADTVGGRDLHAAWRRVYPDAPTELRPVDRPDAAGVSSAKAARLLGWTPRRSWRDVLDASGARRTTG
ncbi:NAD(P)-dependent oxidoreductase [Cellulomonas sp. PhB143]|uniref:NAD-dependent epimerase/dehydratase family protein n=1 Tax=Cellulomonas sp. PhB143 TaxID=2485186 RepID=UPI000F471DDE|nr:NAD(P)-dependent oxidoreductase [Cellulomonas sp. PhB143]ROS76642.1 nucleoside-diphosphate-sugar epimerase [Cellulomonas sp. PhB143]